ncbi:voltage-dependent calcium channel subunit alpha-2/delta-4-like isoform X5 [Stegostoma tigrinum]|uniref:voltage-dependent calcium channel subunit alpha-2/delta-4-like isoform X5 n=1 Tax=Stegostoma tigrinum TaxID=3053191 RepID=UPI0028705EB1|nr:voltage-dependent calcium channel subunit alpha-2/delta-4-like isoform X5 [Stegostoma tigrinum]
MENRMPQWCFKNSLRLFFILWIICFNRCLLYLVKAQNRIPTETVQVWALEFGGELNSIVEKYSGSLLLQKKYKDVEPFIRIEEVDGVELVMQFGEKMKEMLRRKVEAVKRLVDAAEEADLYHKYDMNFEFDYYNSVLINERDKNGNYVELGNEFILEVNEHFNNLPVNTSLSNIQVPTNVYNKDPDILNGAYWSEALNTIFSDNFGQDPTLTWQYFGSSTGFFRLYPGIKWMPDENGVISFDCRNRGWYIQAATSPKDIIILFDISGSMKGLRMTIAKHTINTILDTLGENDFVNIIAYSDYIHYVEPCFEGTLVQADRDNREHFKLLVDKLNAKGTGVVTKALIEAFIILNKFNETGQGSLCNQAIMLITDGAVEDYESVFEQYNWPDCKVRVFTYLIGREVTFAEYVKWIACNNKGYYTHISTLADVQENVMEYLHVLSRPMVINHDHDIIWTEAYMDSALFQSAAHSLLLMTTVAMPVFSRKNETRAHGILLGVVGTDVPLKELLKLAPRYKLGAHGYAFLNTNNGYILAHPDLRPLYKDGKKTKPKPNYNSVDISEVEWEDTYEVLRTAMVNGETGSFSMNVKVPIDDGKRVLFLTNDYFYTHIDDTPFSLCIVLTRGHGESLFIGNISVEEGLHDIDQPDLTLSNEWIYCVTDIDPDHRKLSQKEAVIRYLTGQEPDLECDEELLQEVLFDAVVTAPVEAYWTAIAMNISENNKDGVEMAFLGTRAGLMRSCPFVGKEKSSNKKFFTTQDRHSIFTMDHFPLWYRRAAEHPPGHFVYNIAFEEDIGKKNRSKMVTASTVVSVTVSKRMAIAAAVGVQINLRLMRQKFWMATRQSNDTDCSNIEGTCPISCDNDTGKFLGEVDGSVMTQLLNMGLFTEVKLYDYQAMCKGATNHHSGSQPMLSPFYVILAALKWFLNNLFIFFIEFNLCDLWNREGLVNAKTVFHFGHKHRKVEAFQPCNTEYPAFVHDDTIKEANGFVECGDCQKMFVVQSIENSNLLLLVTEAYCDCSVFPPVTLEPKEVKYNASVKCERMRTQKLRRRPNTCHAFHPEVRKMQRSVEEHLGFLWLECCLHLMWAWLLFYNDEAAVLTNMQRTNLEALPTDAHKAINQAYFY